MNAHYQTKMIRSAFSLGLSLALASFATDASAAATPASCKALVEISNDLYLVSSSGASLFRFTSSGTPKRFPTLAPDASKVAFLTDASPDTVTVVDSAGRQGSFLASAADPVDKPQSPADALSGPLLGLTWETSTVLQLDHHIGSNGERFSYYQVPINLASALPLVPIGFRIALDIATQLHPGTNPSVGAACALSMPSKNIGCVQGSDVRVNGSAGYSSFGFNLAQPIQSLNVAVGSIVSTRGDPSFQVQVSSIQNGITLRVTLPTGNWTQSVIASGGILPITLDDQRFGFLPTITDAKNGIVKLDILQSTNGTQSFDPAVAWHSSDATLAIAERTSAGRNLTVLRRDGISVQWIPIGTSVLAIPEPLTSMQFADATTLLLQTNQRFGLLPVTVVWRTLLSGPTSIQVGSFTELPNKLTVTGASANVTTPVLNWSCGGIGS